MIVLLSENDAYGLWRNEPFPEGSTTDEVDEAPADLAYWDAMVALVTGVCGHLFQEI
jgi:hypothetical protein